MFLVEKYRVVPATLTAPMSPATPRVLPSNQSDHDPLFQNTTSSSATVPNPGRLTLAVKDR